MVESTMRGFCKLVAVAVLLAMAQQAAAFPSTTTGVAGKSRAATHVVNLHAVTVTGVQPGPGLWKVSRGDHVLWILGTLDELPGGIQWQAHDVRERMAQAQRVLQAPVVYIHADVDYFDKLAFNPPGRKLQDVMPPDVYARWLRLKAKYIGRDDGIESHRPIFAAIRLYLVALQRVGLSSQVIDPVIKDAMKQHHLRSTPVVYRAEPVGPSGEVRNFDLAQADDLQCFEKTLDHLESDVEVIRARANAWALGDLDRLLQLPMSDQLDVCRTVIAESGSLRKLGIAGLHAKMRDVWVTKASYALDTDKVSFALLPMEYLLGPDNYLVTLQAQGDRVELPDGLTPPATASTVSATSGAR
jgi:hypothetical protein